MVPPRPSVTLCCCVLLGIALVQLAGAQDDLTKQAAAFCMSPAAKAATCGWVTPAERAVAYTPKGEGCYWWGRRGCYWGSGLTGSPPRTVTGREWDWQNAGNVVSLGCKPGRLIVRAVFKPTAQYRDYCVQLVVGRNSSLASAISDVTRCELQLPPGDEFEAVLRSKEVNCKPCRSCEDCPNNALNKWYSDSFTLNWEGCPGVTKAGAKPYTPFQPAMNIQARSSTVVAKFEVQQL